MRNYLQQKKNNHFVVRNVEVLVKDSPGNGINVRSVVEKSLSLIPSHLLKNLKAIHVGKFQELEDREIQGIFKDSVIFVTNEQDSETDMIDDIVHEIAHSVEEYYTKTLYADKSIKLEFVEKRKKLWFLLKNNGFSLDLDVCLGVEYNRSFDEYLYKTVGYPILSVMTASLFYSPYAITSLREYFANGFEAFFMKEDISRLRRTSPKLYEKILKLLKGKKDEV